MPLKKILIVDDSRTARMMSEMVLKRLPYGIITAEDGQEAVEKAAVEKPDLILMDVVMPRMDGFAAVKAIRAHKEIGAVPIIMVTTRSEADNVERGYENGCNDYVTKPIDSIELVAKIKNLIGG